MEAVLRKEARALSTLSERLGCIPRFLFKIHGQRGRRVPSDWLSDLAQTTFVVVLEKLREFRGEACLETWVYRTCYFQYLAHEKMARRKRPLPVATEALDEHPAAQGSLEEALDRDQAMAELAEVVAELPAEQRRLLERRHFANESFKAIADDQGIPLGTLKNRYYRVLEELKAKLLQRNRTT